MSHPTATALNITILSFIGIVIPFLLWASCFFYRNRNHQIMSYRDPAYVLTVTFSVITGMCLWHTNLLNNDQCIHILFLTLTGLIFASIPRLLHEMDMEIYSDVAIGLISTMITYAILFLFCLKSYLLF